MLLQLIFISKQQNVILRFFHLYNYCVYLDIPKSQLEVL